MKKHILIPLLLLAGSLTANAQNETIYDFMHASADELNGTARYVGVGGAMGAIGGDASAVNSNPAAIGVYRTTEVAASLNVFWDNTRMNGGKVETRPGANLAQISVIGTWASGKETGETYTSLGLTFNRSANFSRSSRMNDGLQGSSITDFLAAYSYGSDHATLSADTAYNNAAIGWASVLADRTGMISDNGDGTFTSLYQSAGGGAYSRYLEWEESGSVNNLNLAVGGAVNNRFYWGFSMEADFLGYTSRRTLMETYADASFAQAVNTVDIDGTGFAMKLGVIYKPVKWVRLGAAFHTPTWWVLKTTSDVAYTSSLSSAQEPPTATDSECRLSSPLRALLSAGFIFKKGFVGLDYQFADYTDMSARSLGRPHAMNAHIPGRVRNTHSIRLGLEVKPVEALALRLGGGYTTPANREGDARLYYANDFNETNDIRTDFDYYNDRGNFHVTCGIGGRFGRHSLDLSYVYQVNLADYYSFDPVYTADIPDPVALRSVRNQLVFTYGLRF
ncbi:MAG: hypothetical protein J6Z12_02155 [Paludibacteraceae bacterium]|nr:hypothetical protein [Paludibacteraceae bacterium]